MNWRGKNVLVTGGSGFLGTHLVNKIEGLGAIVYAPSHDDFDLVHENEIEKMYSSHPTLMWSFTPPPGLAGSVQTRSTLAHFSMTI